MTRTLLAIALLIASASVQAGIIHVPADQPTIQTGIDAAADGDTVLIASGVYSGEGNEGVTIINRQLAVHGEPGTVIGGNMAVFESQLSLRELQISGGEIGILVEGNVLSLHTVAIVGASTGLFCNDVWLSADSCLISNNGVGAEALDAGLLELDWCTFEGNGTALKPWGSITCHITRCDFSNNGAAVSCVVTDVQCANVICTGSDFTDNGVVFSGNAGATNCSFEGNGIVCMTKWPFGVHLASSLVTGNDLVATHGMIDDRRVTVDHEHPIRDYIGLGFTTCEIVANARVANVDPGQGTICPEDYVIFLNFNGCLLAHNTKGIRIGGCSSLSVKNCTLEFNLDSVIVVDGYNINFDPWTPSVFRSNFRHNSGPAIQSTYGDLRVVECTFVDNTAAVRGQEAQKLSISNTVITNNVQAIDCSGLYELAISNSTIAHNHSDGILLADGATNLNLSHSIVAANSGAGIHLVEFTGTVTAQCNNSFDNALGNWDPSLGDLTGVDGNFSADPLFCDPENGDLHIHNTSPCAPDNNLCEAIIGALGVGCYAPTAALSLDTVYALMAWAIELTTIDVTIAGPVDGYAVADIDIPSLLVNSSLSPLAHSLDPEHHSLTFSIRLPTFVSGYGVQWGTSMKTFEVSGQFTDNQPFSLIGSFIFRGHRAGDLNLDGAVNVADVTLLTAILFDNHPVDDGLWPDVNGDNRTNVSDLTLLVGHLFNDEALPTGSY
jgi:hypothetical protein